MALLAGVAAAVAVACSTGREETFEDTPDQHCDVAVAAALSIAVSCLPDPAEFEHRVEVSVLRAEGIGGGPAFVNVEFPAGVYRRTTVRDWRMGIAKPYTEPVEEDEGQSTVHWCETFDYTVVPAREIVSFSFFVNHDFYDPLCIGRAALPVPYDKLRESAVYDKYYSLPLHGGDARAERNKIKNLSKHPILFVKFRCLSGGSAARHPGTTPMPNLYQSLPHSPERRERFSGYPPHHSSVRPRHTAPEAVRRKLAHFYMRRLPKSVDQVDNIMEKYRGREGDIIATFAAKYPTWDWDYDPVEEMALYKRAVVKRKVEAYYTTHLPHRVKDIDSLLARFYGHEEDLVTVLRDRYPTWDWDALPRSI